MSTEDFRQPPIFTGPFVRLSTASFFVFATFQGLMAVIAPYMLAHHLTVAEVGETGAAFVFTAVLIRPWTGRMVDRYGRLRFFLGGLALIAAAFGLYPLTGTLWPLTAVRVLHGIGWGLASTASATLVQDVVPPERRGEATGYYANFNDLAMAFGPFLAVAALTRWGFAAFSWTAAGVLTATGALVAGIKQPAPRSHAPPRSPILPAARLPALVQLLMNLNFGAVMTFLPVIAARRGLMRPVMGVDAYGYFYIVYAGTLLVTRGWLGRLSDRYGRLAVIYPGLVLLLAAALLLAFLHAFGLLLVFAVLFGIGYGAAQPSVLAWTMERVHPTERGQAAGTYFAAFDLGIGIAALAFGPLAAASSFRFVLGLGALSTLAAVAVLRAAQTRMQTYRRGTT